MARSFPGTLRALLAASLLSGAAPALAAGCEDDAGCPGLSFEALYLGDFGANVRGGERTGDGWSHLGRAGLSWNSSLADGTARLTTRASMMYMGGPGIGGRTGDLQGLNNIEAARGVRLYELWTEAQFGRRVSLRSGFLDLNAEFDTPDTAALFVSPPHGIGTEFAMSGRNGPAIWPASGLGLRLNGESGALQWRFAAFEGEPGRPDSAPFARVKLTKSEGALLVGEMAWSPPGTNKLQMGVWQYTARFEMNDPASAGRTARGNRGAYGLVDLPLGRVGAAGVDAALRLGLADSRFNTVDQYVGAVLAFSGLSASLPDDAIGLGLAHARTSGGWRASVALAGDSPRASETALELTWRHALTDQIALLPHVHFVRHPGAVQGPRDAWVVGLRLEAAGSRRIQTFAANGPAPDASAVARNVSQD